MKSRKAFLIAITAALFVSATIAHAQQSVEPSPSSANPQEEIFTAVGGMNNVLVRSDGMYIQCTSCGYVKEFTETNAVPNFPAQSLKTLGSKLTGKPTTHKEILVTIVRPGSGHAEQTMTIVDPKIELHLGDLIYVTKPGGDVRLLKRVSEKSS